MEFDANDLPRDLLASNQVDQSRGLGIRESATASGQFIAVWPGRSCNQILGMQVTMIEKSGFPVILATLIASCNRTFVDHTNTIKETALKASIRDTILRSDD